jgi:TPR repeat protein
MEWARGRETSAGLVEAIAAYKQVSKAAGTADAARAARRLWEIYRDGGSGVTSNNALAQQWYERAQILGAVLPASPASKAAATGKVPPPPDRATAKTRPPSISDPSKGSPSLEWARSLERTDLLVAVPVYQNIADAGTPTDGAKAARRLWEIYRDGGSGMAADPAKARQWYERAQGLGASMPAWTAPGATR